MKFLFVALLCASLRCALAGLAWEQSLIEAHPDATATEARAEFRFTNTGQSPVTILAVEPDCGCTTVALPRRTFAPGETGSVPVVFRFGAREGLQVRTIKVQLEGEAAPTVLTLRTEIPVWLTISPTLVTWAPGEPKTEREARLALGPGVAFTDLKATSLNPAIKVSLAPGGDGRDGALRIQPAAEIPPGVTALDVQATLPGGSTRHFKAYAKIQGAAGPLAGATPLPADRPATSMTPAELLAAWNEEMVQAIRFESSAPALSARNLAIFHLAIEEAVNACAPKYASLIELEAAPAGTSDTAAAIGAAAAVAGDLYPSRRAHFAALLAAQTGGLPAASVQWGEAVGHRMMDSRRFDGATKTVSYIPHTEPGAWRRTPPFFRPPELPNWGNVKPFVLTNVEEFRPGGPPAWHSAQFAADLQELQAVGGAASTARTPAQAEIARFWSDFSYTAMPPGHWNNIARDLAIERKLPLVEAARLLALVNAAMADSGIVCFEAKYHYNTWRPVTAIRQAGVLGLPGVTADPAWLPFLNTPPHPEYPSGHSVFSGAAAQVLRDYFGTDHVHFVVSSDTVRDVRRSFESFSAAEEECALSRIYGGIHFRFSVEDGKTCGEAVGAWVSAHLYTPRAIN